MGTVGFMSPEQIKDEAHVTASSDQFSLGVVAYALLAGRMPFESSSLAATLQRIIEGSPPLVVSINPTLDPAVDTVLNKALAKKAHERYATCSEFVTALLRACDSKPGWRSGYPLGGTPTTAVLSSPTSSGQISKVATKPGEFTIMFSDLAAGPLSAHLKTVPTVFPEPRTTFFRAQNEGSKRSRKALSSTERILLLNTKP